MFDQNMLIAMAAGFAALVIALAALTRGWRDWLDLKRAELDAHMRPAGVAAPAGARIELADLKERVRRLEAIADGVE